MIDTTEPLIFTVNFPIDVLASANGFRHQQQSLQKAEQVYLNTLAVYAVQFYCDCMGIETQLSGSDSWNPAMQTLMDTAALTVQGSTLECRPILSGMDACQVPLEVLDERLGYVMVEINIESSTATLLGFAPTVHQGALHRTDLQSLDSLIDILIPTEPIPEAIQAISTSLEQIPTQLSDWLNSIFEAQWQPPELVFAASHRGLSSTTDFSDAAGITQQERAKSLVVGKHNLVLVVQVARYTDANLDVALKVSPGVKRVLPPGLLLELLDDEAAVAMVTTAKAADNFIALDFQIEPQEAFSVRITVGYDSIIESFMS